MSKTQNVVAASSLKNKESVVGFIASFRKTLGYSGAEAFASTKFYGFDFAFMLYRRISNSDIVLVQTESMGPVYTVRFRGSYFYVKGELDESEVLSSQVVNPWEPM